MRRTGSFQQLFDRIHSGHDYSALVRSHEAYLPGHRGRSAARWPRGVRARRRAARSTSSSSTAARAGTGPSTGPCGCATACDRAATSCSRTTAGTPASGCRCSSAARGPLPAGRPCRRHVRVRARPPARARDVERRFPDEPTDFGRDAFDDIFARLGVDAGERSDVHAMVSLSIQHAGALATSATRTRRGHTSPGCSGGPSSSTTAGA